MIARYAVVFFFTMTLLVAPVLIALLLRWLAPRKYWKWYAGASTLVIWALVIYGSFFEYERLDVHEVTYASADVPKSFDGYRIVQFSDAHVGTYTGYRQHLSADLVTVINRQHPDLIVFTGDLQNVYPDEVDPHLSTLSQLRAKDGVISILGNHDYATYAQVSDEEKTAYERRLQESERQMGWDLLMNEHRVIRRGGDSIVIAGMENWGAMKRMPRRGDVRKTLEGVQPSAFVVMLQHDPTCWREKILPECHAQLTLSGHTHGGQFCILNWSPAALSYDEWIGMTREGDRSLYVSQGAGALIPFRLGMPGEIAVFTLKSKK